MSKYCVVFRDEEQSFKSGLWALQLARLLKSQYISVSVFFQHRLIFSYEPLPSIDETGNYIKG